MTGIERLRKLADKYAEASKDHTTIDVVPGGMAVLFADISDQIERERDKVARTDWEAVREVAADMAGKVFMSANIDGLVREWSRKLTDAADGHERAADASMSAYNLLPAEEREAIAWVRERGGIAYVRDAWNVRSNLERQLGKAQAKVERQQRHIEFVQRKCRERQRRIVELEDELHIEHSDALLLQTEVDWLRSLLDAIAEQLGLDVRYADSTRYVRSQMAVRAAIARRLMPEGMEWLVEAWPRFEDGEPVRFGDKVPTIQRVTKIGLFSDRSYTLYNGFDSVPYKPGERVKRPAPKVVDADGAEIELGDDLYSVEGGLKFHVSHIDRAGGKIATDAMFAIDKWADPSLFTHRAPVLAADGKPLREGETVYLLPGEWCDKWPLMDCPPGCEMKVMETHDVEHAVKGVIRCRNMSPGDVIEICFPLPSQLTHERPDSLERIVADVRDIWDEVRYHLGDYSPSDFKEQGDSVCDRIADLPRRIRTLAERGRR